MLTFFAEPTQTKDSENFSNWLQNGYFNPIKNESRNLTFSTKMSDLSGSLIKDIEFLQNHTYEHIIEILAFNAEEKNRSDAWNTVTIYYFGFFCAQALLRLTGSPIVFLNDQAVKRIKDQLGINLGQGAYKLTLENKESATDGLYELKQLRGRLHDTIWNALHNRFEEIKKSAEDDEQDPNEALFYDYLTNPAVIKIYNNRKWMSEIRNKVNYSAGFAYTLFEGQFPCGSKNLLSRWKELKSENLLLVHRENSRLGSTTLSLQVRYLHDHAFSLFLIFRSLYIELLNRRNISRKMEQRRQRIISETDLFNSNWEFLHTAPPFS